jgi:hypothetical protein
VYTARPQYHLFRPGKTFCFSARKSVFKSMKWPEYWKEKTCSQARNKRTRGLDEVPLLFLSDSAISLSDCLRKCRPGLSPAGDRRLLKSWHSTAMRGILKRWMDAERQSAGSAPFDKFVKSVYY